MLLIVGHPACGGKFISRIFTVYGCEIGYKVMGKFGLCNWRSAVKTYNFGIKRLIMYVRDPVSAIKAIIARGRENPEYSYRQETIKRLYGVNLDDFSDVDAAVLSFLYWNQMIKDQSPELIIKVEEATHTVKNFLEERCNKTPKFTPNEPEFLNNFADDQQKLIPTKNLLDILDAWCIEYGYKPFSQDRLPMPVPKIIPKVTVQEEPKPKQKVKPVEIKPTVKDPVDAEAQLKDLTERRKLKITTFRMTKK